MKIYINEQELILFQGATALDAVRQFYTSKGMKIPKKTPLISDKYGNEVSPDGSLSEGNQLFIKIKCSMVKTLIQRWFCCSAIVLSLFAAQGCGASKKSAAAQQPQPKTIEILAVNDMHATIDNFPRLAFMVDSLRAIYPDLLLISGGDNQTGNPVNDQYNPKGMPMIELMNALKFDLSAVGNHEFDSKIDGFNLHTREANFDFICGNLTPPLKAGFNIKPYKEITMPNGAKIAFASLLQINEGGIPDTHPDNVKGFIFEDPYQKAAEYLFLKENNDVLAFVNHLGFEEDTKLANQLPKDVVELIIGGHSHTKVDKNQIHNGAMITQAENKLKYATLIQLTIQPNGELKHDMKLLPVGNKGNERADIRAMVDAYNNNPALKEKIAVAQADFTSYDQVGYLMTDALRAEADTDIALINPGGVRVDHLPKGDISPMDVYRMDPFGNEMVLFKLTGHEIRSMMLNAFKRDENIPIYPSGLHSRYIFDADKNLKDVQLFTTDNQPLDMDKTYTVATNNYMAAVYQFEHKDPGTGLFKPTAESMIEYLRKLKTIPSYKDVKRIEIE